MALAYNSQRHPMPPPLFTFKIYQPREGKVVDFSAQGGKTSALDPSLQACWGGGKLPPVLPGGPDGQPEELRPWSPARPENVAEDVAAPGPEGVSAGHTESATTSQQHTFEVIPLATRGRTLNAVATSDDATVCLAQLTAWHYS
jgi:hypothetical protein